jgi:predicted RNA-binding protein YlqC (UPF0109 family)
VTSDSSLFEGPNFSSTPVPEDIEDEIGAPEADPTIDGGTAQAVLEHIARSIVDDPDSVVVEAGPGRSGTKLSLHVNPDDMGRIIGKRGRIAQALRTVVRAAGARDGADISVDIVD